MPVCALSLPCDTNLPVEVPGAEGTSQRSYKPPSLRRMKVGSAGVPCAGLFSLAAFLGKMYFVVFPFTRAVAVSPHATRSLVGIVVFVRLRTAFVL